MENVTAENVLVLFRRIAEKEWEIMPMLDKFGTKISKGAMLWWLSKELPVHVIDVIEPTLVNNDNPPMLILAIRVPIGGVDQRREAVLGDFLCVVDSTASDQLLDRLEQARKQ
jgi:hypothetical protein